jgi:hypothetical protein
MHSLRRGLCIRMRRSQMRWGRLRCPGQMLTEEIA